MGLHSENTTTNGSISSGLIWSFGERILAQLVSTIVGIILARILAPEDYGIISIVMIFINLCDVFVASGFGAAVVQKKDAELVDFNTSFILGFLLSIALYIVLFISAPHIALFYEMESLCPVIRVLGLRIILTSLNTIQQAHIRRQMNFRKFFFSTSIGTVVSCVIGIVLAYNGFGVWSLVVQYLANTGMSSLALCFICGWNPKIEFSWERAKEILSTAWKLLCAQLISTLGTDIRNLIVGKAMGATQLAYYDQGKKYPSLLINNVNTAINKVMLPAFSRNQDDISVVKHMLRRSIRIGIYFIAPIMIGLAVVAENFVSVILTDKWLPVVSLIQIFCLSYLTRPLEETCRQAVIAIGKSELALKVISLINIVSLVATIVVVALSNDILYIALVALAGTMISLCGFMITSKQSLGYLFSEQLQDISPPLIASMVMGVLVYIIDFIPLSSAITLVLQVACGVITYLVLSILLKLEGFSYISTIWKRITKK